MKPTELTRYLIHEAADNAVPDVHLWPAIREQLQPRRVKPAHKGMLSMAAALLLVIVCAAVLLLQVSGDQEPKSKIPQAHLQDITQTVAEQTTLVPTPQQMTVEAPDTTVPDLEFTFIAPDNFVNNVFEQAGELTWQQPRDDFALEQFPGEAIVEANGWAVVQAIGDYYVPSLEVGLADDSSQTSSYRSHEGAILFNLVDNENPPTDPIWYNSSLPYNFIVDGNITNLQGNYKLRVWPVTDPIDLATESGTFGLRRNEAKAIRFDAQTFNTLVIDVVNNPYTPAPDIAVLMPGGQTLTVFNPHETNHLSINLLGTVETGDQYLLFVAQDICHPNMDLDQCKNQRKNSEIELHVYASPLDTNSNPQSGFLPSGTISSGIQLPISDVEVNFSSSTYHIWVDITFADGSVVRAYVRDQPHFQGDLMILPLALTPEENTRLEQLLNNSVAIVRVDAPVDDQEGNVNLGVTSMLLRLPENNPLTLEEMDAGDFVQIHFESGEVFDAQIINTDVLSTTDTLPQIIMEVPGDQLEAIWQLLAAEVPYTVEAVDSSATPEPASLPATLTPGTVAVAIPIPVDNPVSLAEMRVGDSIDIHFDSYSTLEARIIEISSGFNMIIVEVAPYSAATITQTLATETTYIITRPGESSSTDLQPIALSPGTTPVTLAVDSETYQNLQLGDTVRIHFWGDDTNNRIYEAQIADLSATAEPFGSLVIQTTAEEAATLEQLINATIPITIEEIETH
jgi:hypothetical protein